MKWMKIMVGLCAVAIFIPAYCYYFFIDSSATQEQCEAEGAVSYGTEMQMLVDEFKKQFGRYPAMIELTNLLEITISGVPPTNYVRWYYNESTGEISINSRIYCVGYVTRVNLSNTSFRRPTKVQELYFGMTKTLDYTWENDRVDKEKVEITEVITNWYMTNTIKRHGEHAVGDLLILNPANAGK